MLNPAAPAGADVLDAGALAQLRELDPIGANHLLERVLIAFKSSVARLVPQIREACAAGDLAGVRHVAHTLKSSSASIGATALARVCGEIESMIRADHDADALTQALAPRVEALCAEVEVVERALGHLLDAPS